MLMRYITKISVKKWAIAMVVMPLLLLSYVQATPYEKNTRVCFIGDSITHKGFYPYYIRLFYSLRRPEKPVYFFNCGIAGGTAKTANSVYQWDIKAKNIDAATIMLGMNDVGQNFGSQYQTPKEINSNVEKQISAVKGISLLSKRLLTDEIQISLITPSIYDQTASFNSSKPNLLGKNDALKYISQHVNALATKHSLPLFDFQKATFTANEKLQQQNPKATVIGKDRVHPAEVGHFLMAHEFLTKQEFSPFISKTIIDIDKGKVIEALNNKISDLKITVDEVSFTSLESSLPFPIPEEAKSALALIPFNQTLNQQHLQLQGLETGLWTVYIDDIEIGQYLAKTLDTGINLAENTKTPMYQQALQVAQKSYLASELDANILRGITWIKAFLLRDDKLNINNLIAVEKHLHEKLPKKSFQQKQSKIYLANYQQEQKIEQQVFSFFKQSYKLSQPITHSFTFRKL